MSSARNYTFRDAGLHSRVLRAANTVARAAGGIVRSRLPLDPESLLDSARRETGLDEFGADTLAEPLEVLERSIEGEANLTPFGRMAMRSLLVSSLANRLRVLDWVRRHPEVASQQIERPWIVIGLPRTGTSLLSILLGLDPLARPLEHWEAASPVPPPELASFREDPRIAESAKTLEQLQSLNPPIRAMHPFGATMATECVTLLIFDLRSLSIETQGFLPSYGSWLEKADMRNAYALHKKTLQILQSKIPTRAWSLKTPNHLWCIEAMLECYPDARVIWTHRDPSKVVPSVASLNTSMHRMMSDDVDPIRVGNDWNHKLHLAVSRGMAFDESADPGWCHHLLYEDLIRDSIASMRKLYAHFGDEVHPHHEALMEAWIRERPQQAFGRHRYEPRDFGFTSDGINEQYGEYAARFEIPSES